MRIQVMACLPRLSACGHAWEAVGRCRTPGEAVLKHCLGRRQCRLVPAAVPRRSRVRHGRCIHEHLVTILYHSLLRMKKT